MNPGLFLMALGGFLAVETIIEFIFGGSPPLALWISRVLWFVLGIIAVMVGYKVYKRLKKGGYR